MMNVKKALLSIALAGAVLLWVGMAAEAKGPNQVKCPVMGSSINKKIYTDYKGKRIYFCCPPCVQDFKKNPEKYMKKIEKDGVVLEDAPTEKK